MHIGDHNLRNVEVCDRTENLENWYQNEWSGFIVVLEQFWGQGQKRKHDLVAQILEGHSVIDFLDHSWYNCLEGFYWAK